MPLPESIHTKMWFVCGGVVGCLGVGACSNCTSGHRMGMSIQRCSSPWHGAIKLHCQSSRGIQKCFVLSSQVFDATYLSFSNKDMYCKEILYKYSHGLLSMARGTTTSLIRCLHKDHHRQSCANCILYTNLILTLCFICMQKYRYILTSYVG